MPLLQEVPGSHSVFTSLPPAATTSVPRVHVDPGEVAGTAPLRSGLSNSGPQIWGWKRGHRGRGSLACQGQMDKRGPQGSGWTEQLCLGPG